MDRQTIRKEIRRVLSEDDPCWDGYTMVGMKMQGGEEVPNCVPDEDAEDYDPDEIQEMTTTLAVPGYNTPFAFAPADDEDEEDLEERLQQLNDRVGFTEQDELMTPEAQQDFISYFAPYMVQNQGIAEKIKRKFLRPVNEVKARTGVGGRRKMGDGEGKVFRVANPNSRYGGDDLAVDAIIEPDGEVEIVRVLGFSTGKPPAGNIDHDTIERMIARGDAEEMPGIKFMAQN
jgi:hypothetical protein